MKYSVQAENELDASGAKKQYDIFSNHFSKFIRFGKPHVHSYYETVLILEGELIYKVEDQAPITLHEGDIVFIPPYIIHDTYMTPETKLRSIVVKFSSLFLYPLETTQSDVDCLLITPNFEKNHYLFRKGLPSNAKLAIIMKTCLEETNEQLPGYELALRGHLINLYISLIRSCGSPVTPPQPAPPLPQEVASDTAQQLHRILVYLQENYRYNISMQEVADVCGMSYYHFSRFFKRMTAKKFNEYLLEMRLNYARKELLQNDKSISDISLDCGFEYVSYFIQKFKNKTGLTPKEFQKKYRVSEFANEEDAQKNSTNAQNSGTNDPI